MLEPFGMRDQAELAGLDENDRHSYRLPIKIISYEATLTNILLIMSYMSLARCKLTSSSQNWPIRVKKNSKPEKKKIATKLCKPSDAPSLFKEISI